MSVIKTEHLTHTYSQGTSYEQAAVSDVNLEIEAGEMIGVIGHTGSGKSTLIQHFNGLLRPTSGKIYVDGEDIWEKPKEIRRIRFKVGLVFQYPEYQLFEDTVYKDIAFGPKNMGLSEEEIDRRVKEAALFVGLKPEHMEKSPFELSGGMKQRVGIAMSMTARPRLLLADEPTSALDVTIQAEVVREMKKLREQYETAIILVTHNMGVASYISDKIGVMCKGELVEFGKRDDVIFHPKHEYTKKLLAAVPRLEGKRFAK